MANKYRVIQWATGSVGCEALKGILLHPELELAGVKVYSAEKQGVDAGQLCGMPNTGITALLSTEDILTIDADCVVYTPNLASLDEVCALLSSGKNVVCSPFLFYAEHLPPEDRARVREACQRGNTSVYGSGIHPGFVGMVLPLAMSGMSRRIDKLVISEKADWAFYNSPKVMFDNMRFGHPPQDVTLSPGSFLAFNGELFKDQIVMLAKAFGTTLDDITLEHEVLTADESYDVMAGRIEAGTVYAQRFLWQGITNGEVTFEIDALWTVGGQYPAHWPEPAHGWTVTLEGEPSLTATFSSMASVLDPGSRSLDDHIQASSIATAMQCVNSVPAVCAAEPGIRGAFELQPVYSGYGMRSRQ